MDDLERIARAICRADYDIKDDKDQFSDFWPLVQDKEKYYRMAREVIDELQA